MKNYFKILLVLFVAIVFSSCLKDKYNALDPDGSPRVVEIKNPDFISTLTPAGSLYSMYTSSLKFGSNVEVTYTVQLSGADGAPNDVTVTLGSDAAVVGLFNNDQKTRNPAWVNYDLLPSNMYEFKQTSVTIPAGQRSVNFVVGYKVDQFDFSKNYILPIVIKSTSFGTVSKNFGTILANVAPRNAYDGVYSFQAPSVINRYTNGVLNTGDALMGNLVGLPNRVLTTVPGDAYTLALTPLWANNSAVGGIDNLRIKINPTTNEVTMVSLGNATLKNSVGKVNKYDPVTKTFTLNFDWSPGAASRDMQLTLKFESLRP